jgi:glycosyltransferase involved in cell wall biosynthesis
MSKSPQVSVVMTVWNGGKYIAESIHSILDQTFQDFELVVVDDGSTDNTCEIVETFQDSRLRLFRRPHEGVLAAVKFGVSAARGRYIARLDADDISLPERIAAQVEALARNPRAVLCYTNAEIFGENLFGDLSPHWKAAHFTRDPALLCIQFCARCPLIHSSVMFRREAYESIGGYPDIYPCEDYSLYTQLLRVGTFVALPAILTRYRRHAGSATARLLGQMQENTAVIGLDHISWFLKVDSAAAARLFAMFRCEPAGRDWAIWVSFCARVLRHPSCWRPEPLSWLLSQSLRIALKRG